MRRRSVGSLVILAALRGAWPALAQEGGAAPRLDPSQHFTIDPVVDSVLIVGGLGFSAILSRILSTGEIQPMRPGSPDHLLSIDRVAVEQTPDPHANTLSNIGLWTATGFAVLDPILSGLRDGQRAMLVDALLYAESIGITQAFTDATKIGVRRPRPIDYLNCSGSQVTEPASCSSTDMQLSFFSGHAATTGAIAATATYLAFVRSGPRAPRPWITLAAGTLLTAFVSYERVRAAEHFPTDVIVGSMAGAAIGTLVPHFHRRAHYHGSQLEAPAIWIGVQPISNGPGALTLGGRF